MERRTALIVDHDLSTAELISRLLYARGYETVVATTYAQGWSLFDSTRPRVLVIDPVLVDGDGLELARKATSSAHVVLSSAFPARTVDSEYPWLPLVVKPFATHELLAHIPDAADSMRFSVSEHVGADAWLFIAIADASTEHANPLSNVMDR